MKLLMITRKVDMQDPRMGFFYQWVEKIGERLEKLYVISWQTSNRGQLPNNIEIISLSANKLFKIIVLEWQLLRILPKVDGVFCHMNPEYTILTAPLAKIFRKRIVSWYTHGTISFRLKLMARLADKILTASRESFRLPSEKLIITGHGIDTQRFSPAGFKNQDKLRLLTVGRISPTKDYESIIKAIYLLAKQGLNIAELNIIGDVGLKEQEVYFNNLKDLVRKVELDDKIKFLGPMPNSEVPKYLSQADVFINLSGTGSLDKAILEAMACGCLVLTSNEAFAEILPKELMVENNQPEKLAEKIKWLMNLPQDQADKLRQQARQEVVANHNLNNLVEKIINCFK